MKLNYVSIIIHHYICIIIVLQHCSLKIEVGLHILTTEYKYRENNNYSYGQEFEYWVNLHKELYFQKESDIGGGGGCGRMDKFNLYQYKVIDYTIDKSVLTRTRLQINHPHPTPSTQTTCDD